jgi:hypothetical protein
MKNLPLSNKGHHLIELYETMVSDGCKTPDGMSIKSENMFNGFQIRPYKELIKPIMANFSISSVLDYGCGGADWELSNFDSSGKSAKSYFNLERVYRYEPSRNIDERQIADCVISFDVLEHVYISDVANTIRDMLRNASKLIIINVACYPAKKLLPNGENAHITVRPPLWWKGMFDAIAPEFPNIEIFLACSEDWQKTDSFEIYSAKKWEENEDFVTELGELQVLKRKRKRFSFFNRI